MKVSKVYWRFAREKTFGRLTRKYGGVGYPFGNLDWQRVIRDVEGIVSVPVYDDVIPVATLRVRVL